MVVVVDGGGWGFTLRACLVPLAWFRLLLLILTNFSVDVMIISSVDVG
jgi:hypothetical protein